MLWLRPTNTNSKDGRSDWFPGRLFQEKKGADGGIDGVIRFIDNPTEDPKLCLIQVKGGHVSVRDVRDLKGTMKREVATIGMLITLHPATGPR